MDKSKVTWKVDMFDRVKTVCDENITIVNSVTALGAVYIVFNDKLVLVKNRMELVSLLDNGYAAAKAKTWEELAQKLDMYCGSLSSYAKRQGNLTLLAQARFAPSVFTGGRCTDAIAQAGFLIDLLNTHVANLADFNVTPAKMTAATNLLTLLSELNSMPTTERSNGKVLRQLLFKQVTDLTNLVKSEMDPLVNSLQEDETQFVEQYFAARRIQKTGIRHEGPELPKKDLMENLAISVSSLQTETKEAKSPVNDGFCIASC